ncbi:uncharacterized protein LOC127875769 isoform X2 [Dreissena polymorpha]|nr:uncharacterized protein LOC127875769 isoform X2 [Dreissena polymorpha]
MQGSYAEFERNKVKTMRLNIQSFLVQCDDTSMNETFENVEYILDEIRQKVNLLLTDFENGSIKEHKEELKLNQAPLISVIKTCIRHHGELLPLHKAMQKVKYQPELSLIAHYKCLDKIQQCEIYMNENFSDELFSVKGVVSKYKVRIFRDSDTCNITAVCALPDGQVLVADWQNDKVKLLNQQYQVVDFNMYDLLMLPQCKGNNHWVLLFASVMSRTVTIYDSLGGNNKALFDLFCQFMCQRAQIVNDGLEKIQFRVQSATLQQTAPWKQLWSVCIDDCQMYGHEKHPTMLRQAHDSAYQD